MLTESLVIDAVCRFLRHKGWSIRSRCSEMQRGDDIVVEHRSRKLIAVIEAKGETSSKRYTARYGKAFSSRQVTSHVSRAFFRAAQGVGQGLLSALALPKTELHVSRVRSIREALSRLKLEVFWVLPDGRVEVEGTGWMAVGRAVRRTRHL